MRALLDVNVPIALLDFGSMRSGLATQWLRDNLERGWASCPLTQNGCIRNLSQPAYLLLMAVRRDPRLVTFYRAVPLQVVPGAQSRHLSVI